MSYAQTVLVTLIVYKLVLIGIGFMASRRTKDESDFLLGGRSLGPPPRRKALSSLVRRPVSFTHLRAHETLRYLVCRMPP